MGIEKLIPRAKDLGVFLRLLARSRHRPADHHVFVALSRPAARRRVAHRAGRQWPQRNLGERRISPFVELHSLRGVHEHLPGISPQRRAQLRNDRARPDRLDPGAGRATRRQFATLPHACSLCGSCTDVCPVKIDIHHQLLTWRREIAHRGYLPLTKRLSMKAASIVFRYPLALSASRERRPARSCRGCRDSWFTTASIAGAGSANCPRCRAKAFASSTAIAKHTSPKRQ